VQPGPSRWSQLLQRWAQPALLVVTVAALAASGIGWLDGWLDACWVAGTLVAMVPALVWVATALRHKRAGVDLIAMLSLVGTLLVQRVPGGGLYGLYALLRLHFVQEEESYFALTVDQDLEEPAHKETVGDQA
jgi:hypothetical protein